ncbi:MAG: purine phosphoribosyltransferase family protein, partial [Halobacteriovoraceae bacterium]|nr:purine phosphoribosyltransferase family protein [Halobacteriovoraceae bacterium]
MNIESKIRIIPDFPKKGIMFRDITTLLKNPQAFEETIKRMADYCKRKEFDYVVGIESRGFIIGAALALHLKKGFIPIRK